MGPANSDSGNDVDILPYVLSSGESIEVTGTVSPEAWPITDWTLYITDTADDTSVIYDRFDLWAISYVDIHWDSGAGGYTCEFVY